jgi:Zn-dependent protease with chaperone function
MTAIETLGWTLVHFLWQGAAIAFLFAVVDRALRDANARARYGAACGAMLLMLACAAGTFAWLYPGSAAVRTSVAATAAPGTAIPGPEALGGGEIALGEIALGGIALSAPADFSRYLPLLVYFWFAGVCVLGVRSLGGWVVVQRMRRQAARPAAGVGEEQLARLARRLGVTRIVRLRESAMAQAPAVIGWLKPVVLLPATALSGLTPQQIEALLAHELAHIRRHDYLVNLLQTAIETLLFYHPAVWWVGRRIRTERENCCDDLAVEVCGDALAYARALARLEQVRQQMPQLAMASSHGSLLHRIQRLLSPKRTAAAASGRQTAWNGALSGLLLLAAVWTGQHLSLQSGFSQAPENPDRSVEVAIEQAVEATPAVAPAPSADVAVEKEAAPAVAPTPSVDVTPQVNAAPTVRPAPSVDVAPAVKPARAVKRARAVKPAPDAKAAPKVQATPDVKPAPVEVKPDPKPAPNVNRVVEPDATGVERGAARRELRGAIRESIRQGVHGTVAGTVAGTVQGTVQGTVNGAVHGTVHGSVQGAIRGGIQGGIASGVFEGVVTGIQHGIDDAVHVMVATTVHDAVHTTARGGALHALGLAHQVAQTTGAGAEASGDERQGGFIDGLAAAGYRDLSVDQLIKLKTHGVTPEYVRGMQAAGLQPSADELAKLRVHGVTPEYVRGIQATGLTPSVEELAKLRVHGVTPEFLNEMKATGIDVTLDQAMQFRIHGVDLKAVGEMGALGYKLSPDEMVKMRIHGLTVELARAAKQLGFGDPSFKQLLNMRIHGITPEFAASMKETGMRDLSLDQLVKLRIHGADPAAVRELVELGYKDLSANDVVKMRVHGVTPVFIREVQRRGFKDLDLDKIIKLKQLGIVDEPAFI